MYQTLNPKTFLGITSVDDFWNWYAKKKRLSWGLQERESEREKERECVCACACVRERVCASACVRESVCV